MAYNRYYQYETSPRKLKPEYEPVKKTYPKRSTAKRISKKEEAKMTKAMYKKIIFYIAMCFVGLFVISYRYALIDDTHASLKKEETKLAALEKENKQIEANIESNLNLSKIEQEAKDLLGMQKLSSEQIVYVTLPKIDHIEASSEKIKTIENQNWLIAIFQKIAQNFQ